MAGADRALPALLPPEHARGRRRRPGRARNRRRRRFRPEAPAAPARVARVADERPGRPRAALDGPAGAVRGGRLGAARPGRSATHRGGRGRRPRPVRAGRARLAPHDRAGGALDEGGPDAGGRGRVLGRGRRGRERPDRAPGAALRRDRGRPRRARRRADRAVCEDRARGAPARAPPGRRDGGRGVRGRPHPAAGEQHAGRVDGDRRAERGGVAAGRDAGGRRGVRGGAGDGAGARIVGGRGSRPRGEAVARDRAPGRGGVIRPVRGAEPGALVGGERRRRSCPERLFLSAGGVPRGLSLRRDLPRQSDAGARPDLHPADGRVHGPRVGDAVRAAAVAAGGAASHRERGRVGAPAGGGPVVDAARPLARRRPPVAGPGVRDRGDAARDRRWSALRRAGVSPARRRGRRGR